MEDSAVKKIDSATGAIPKEYPCSRRYNCAALDVVYAGSAIDALDREVEMGAAVPAPGDVMGEIDRGHGTESRTKKTPISPLARPLHRTRLVIPPC